MSLEAKKQGCPNCSADSNVNKFGQEIAYIPVVIQKTPWAFKEDSDLGINFGFLKREALAVPGMTPDEELARQRYGYKSWDILKLSNERSRYGSYSIEINGTKESIPSSQLLLFIFMARKLKKDKKGWITREETAKARITNPYENNHFDDLIHKLRNKIGPYLKTCKKDEFLETSQRRFRLSTHPGRILVSHERWLGDTFNEIKAGLLKKRKKKGEQWQDQ